MYKIEISGKNLKELNANIRSFVEEHSPDANQMTLTSSNVMTDQILSDLAESKTRREFEGVQTQGFQHHEEEFLGSALKAMDEQLVKFASPTMYGSFNPAPEVPPNDPSKFVFLESTPVDARPVSNDRDVRGLPFDSRIHIGPDKKNKDGSFTNKRGLDKLKLAEVETELKSRVQSASTVTPPPVPAPLISSLMLHKENILPIPAVPIVPNQNVSPVKPAPVAQAEPKYEDIQVPQGVRPVYSYQSFKANFPMVLANLINEKKIDQNYIDQLKKHFEVKEIWNVMGSEAKCMEIFETFAQVGLVTKVD